MDIIKRNKFYILIGLLPAVLLYTTFVLYPIVRSFFYGFYSWNGLGSPKFIGLDNFVAIFKDSVFWLSFRNNIYVVIFSVFAQIPIGLILAYILSRKLRGAGFFQTAFFIPMMLSTVVVGLLWSTLLNSQVGIVNILLEKIGLARFAYNWLGDPKYAMFTVCMVIVWQFFGYYMLIFLAAIQNIPEEVMEAAEIDGAKESTKLMKITMPMLWPTIITSIVLCISGSMRSFDLVFVMTQGGPANATELMATYMYNKTFSVYKYGYGSAVSLVIFAISFSLILLSQTLLRRQLDD